MSSELVERLKRKELVLRSWFGKDPKGVDWPHLAETLRLAAAEIERLAKQADRVLAELDRMADPQETARSELRHIAKMNAAWMRTALARKEADRG